MEGMLVFELDTGTFEDVLEVANLKDGGKAQQQFDESFLKSCDPYVPVESMALLDSAYRSTEFGSGEIVWNTPYARYQYFGTLMVDPETGKGAFYGKNYGFWSRKGVQKVLSDRKLTYHDGGLRGSHWAERAWADHQEEIIAETQAVVDKGTK